MTGKIPVLEIKNLRIRFKDAPERAALDDLSLKLPLGKTLAVVGESGSGKSLTALALMGLLPRIADWQGEIRFFQEGGELVFDKNSAPAEWRSIRGSFASMVFQEPMSALNPVITVGKQLREAITAHHNMSAREATKTAVDWFRKVQLPEPEKIYDRYPHQLSGGQKQRVMIAMAMSCQPRVLIADEPTTALDVTVQKEILTLMRSLQLEYGTAMIFITHDLALAKDLADDILVLYQGKVMEYGEAGKVLTRPQSAYTRALISCRPGPEAKGKKLPVIADFMERETAPLPVMLPELKISTEPLLKVRNMRVWFPVETNLFGVTTRFFRAVEDVSFDIFGGEVLGLVGESGCGKSTISRTLMGLQKPESGKMIFDGKDLAHLDAGGWRSMRRDVQMIFQDPYASLNPRITVGEALVEPMIVHGIAPRREAKKEAKRLMNLVQLPEKSLQLYPHQFSGGQRQRIGIARALALKPKLIICDESVSALDVSVQAQILNLLKELQAELKLSYLFISHDLNVVYYISDRVLVMQKGKIVERGTADEVLKHPRNEYTRKLVAAIP